jgi:hypothetical protein
MNAFITLLLTVKKAMLSSVMETALLILVASLLANDARNHMKLEWRGENLTDEIKHYLDNLIAAVVGVAIIVSCDRW